MQIPTLKYLQIKYKIKTSTAALAFDSIPKVTLKVINQDRMFFADFTVNCQPIFMKFCNNHILTES